MPLTILQYGDKILRKRALPIDDITPEIVAFAQQMIETMIDANGVGLAAPQVGRLIRMFIRRDERREADGEYSLGPPEVILNPHLSKPSQEKVVMKEGCLSLPGVELDVARPRSIHLRYQTLQGEWKEELATDFLARVTMHENDHLNGVLIIDRACTNSKK
jgi:peptide deformylase